MLGYDLVENFPEEFRIGIQEVDRDYLNRKRLHQARSRFHSCRDLGLTRRLAIRLGLRSLPIVCWTLRSFRPLGQSHLCLWTGAR